MKKLIALASVALFATFAQAATYTWSNIDGTGSTRDGSWRIPTSGFTFVLSTADSTYSNTMPASGTVSLSEIRFIQRDDNNWSSFDHFVLTSTATGKQWTSSSVANEHGTRLTLVGDAYYTRTALIITFEDTDVDVTDTLTLVGYTDATTAGEIGTNVVRNAADNGWNPAVRITATDVPAPVVPEPTALALLALGVAGLALRRKA